MESYGFTVTRHYLGLETAWRAEYTSGIGGHVVGVNAEMDSLPGIGHACGHNLIAVAGVGVAIGLQAALKQHNISGKVILLGTPGKSLSTTFLFLSFILRFRRRRRRWQTDSPRPRRLQGDGRLSHVCPMG